MIIFDENFRGQMGAPLKMKSKKPARLEAKPMIYFQFRFTKPCKYEKNFNPIIKL
jgi:hypothetical protein